MIIQLLQMPQATTYEQLPAVVVDIVEPTLWWINVVLCILVSFIFLQNMRKSATGQKFLTGCFIFSLFFGLGRILENIRKFYIASDRMDIAKWFVDLGPAISTTEIVLRIIYYALSWFSISTFYYITEKHVFQGKTKFIFMFSGIGEGVTAILLYFTDDLLRIIIQMVAVVLFFVCGVAPVLLYLIMAIKSTGVLRQSAFLAALGFLFFVMAILAELPESNFVVYLVTGQFLDAWLIAGLAPLSMTLGLILLVIGYKKMFAGLF